MSAPGYLIRIAKAIIETNPYDILRFFVIAVLSLTFLTHYYGTAPGNVLSALISLVMYPSA